MVSGSPDESFTEMSGLEFTFFRVRREETTDPSGLSVSVLVFACQYGQTTEYPSCPLETSERSPSETGPFDGKLRFTEGPVVPP